MYMYVCIYHVHNRDQTKNCEKYPNRTDDKNNLYSFLWLKYAQILFLILLRLLPKYKKPSYMVSIFSC